MFKVRLSFLVFVLFVFLRLHAQEWQNITPDNIQYLYDFSFISSTNGWISAISDDTSRLLHTIDGCNSFNEVFKFNDEFGLTKFQMVDSLIGYGIILKDQNFFWKTIDGGSVWTDITDTSFMKPNSSIEMNSQMFFISPAKGFIGGRTAIYRTLDSCRTWLKCNTPQIIDTTIPNWNTFRVKKIFFVDESHGWAVCDWIPDSGFGMKTIDGGVNWEICTNTQYPYLSDVNFCDSLIGGISGENGFGSILALTENNFISLTHEYYSFDINQLTNTLFFQDTNTLWVSGMPAIIKKSSDRGMTFIDYTIPGIPLHNSRMKKISFINNIGYAWGYANTDVGFFLAKYEDTLTNVSHSYRRNILSIKLIPNPTNEYCHLMLQLNRPEMTKVFISSLDGIIFFQKEILCNNFNDILLDNSKLVPGIYLVKVYSSTFMSSLIMIKY